MVKYGKTIIVAFILFLLASATVLAAEDNTKYSFGHFYYHSHDGYVSICGYLGRETDIEIPSGISGKPVSEVESNSFAGCNSIQTITVPDTVVVVHDDSFTGASSLKKIISHTVGITINADKDVTVEYPDDASAENKKDDSGKNDTEGKKEDSGNNGSGGKKDASGNNSSGGKKDASGNNSSGGKKDASGINSSGGKKDTSGANDSKGDSSQSAGNANTLGDSGYEENGKGTDSGKTGAGSLEDGSSNTGKTGAGSSEDGSSEGRSFEGENPGAEDSDSVNAAYEGSVDESTDHNYVIYVVIVIVILAIGVVLYLTILRRRKKA